MERTIRITIQPVEDRPGEYVASYRSECLQARYCVYVKDTIFGALHNFAEMVRKAFGKNYRTGEIDFDVSQESAGFTDKAFIDVVEHRSVFCA